MKCTKVRVEFGVYLEYGDVGDVVPKITNESTMSSEVAADLLLNLIKSKDVKDGYFPDGDFSTYEYWLTDAPRTKCADAYVHFEPIEETEES